MTSKTKRSALVKPSKENVLWILGKGGYIVHIRSAHVWMEVIIYRHHHVNVPSLDTFSYRKLMLLMWWCGKFWPLVLPHTIENRTWFGFFVTESDRNWKWQASKKWLHLYLLFFLSYSVSTFLESYSYLLWWCRIGTSQTLKATL